MTIAAVNTIEAKEQFVELVNRVAHNKERILITRRGKEIVALIPAEDLQLLLQSQDKHDLHDAINSLKEARDTGTVSLTQLKEDLGV